jgi:probable HAF family extracellular repeat protein
LVVSRIATGSIRPSYLGAIGLAGLVASVTLVTSSNATGKVEAACSPSMSILKSPRVGSKEVQAKALNDRGDIVGFADSTDGTYRAILWKGGKLVGAVDLGVLPGYVSSEAYGVNNDRVVFGLLYDKKERTFPFRWEDGRMTVLRGPNGRIQQAAIPNRTRSTNGARWPQR